MGLGVNGRPRRPEDDPAVLRRGEALRSTRRPGPSPARGEQALALAAALLREPIEDRLLDLPGLSPEDARDPARAAEARIDAGWSRIGRAPKPCSATRWASSMRVAGMMSCRI